MRSIIMKKLVITVDEYEQCRLECAPATHIIKGRAVSTSSTWKQHGAACISANVWSPPKETQKILLRISRSIGGYAAYD